MARRTRKIKDDFNSAEFSAKLKELAVTPKPVPVREDSELVKRVRENYEMLKQVIVVRGWSYADVSDLFVRTGLKKGASPPSVKAALIKVAAERGEVWDYRKISQGSQDNNEVETSNLSQPNSSKSAKSSKFVDMPGAL